MNVFDQPPATPPVSFEPPQPPRRGPRPIVIGAAAALLVGGGIVGIAQLVDADRPDSSTAVLLAATPDDEPVDESSTGPDDADESTPSDDVDESTPESDDSPDVDGEIVIDVGGDEPLVIEFDDESLGRVQECLPIDVSFDIGPFEPGEAPEIGELPFPDVFADLFEDLLDEDGRLRPGALDEFFQGGPFGELHGDIVSGGPIDLDGRVTVVTEDGVTVVELGDGDGSVTITRDDGEIEITTDGDATVHEPGEWLAELDEWADGLPRRIPPRWEEWFEADGELPAIDELFGELPDLDDLRECLADALDE